MKRSGYRKLRDVPDVDYREKEESDDLYDTESEEEERNETIDGEPLEAAATSTPFNLAPPRLLVEGTSLHELGANSSAEDFHSAATFLGQLSEDSDVRQRSVESDTRTVVEGELSPALSQPSDERLSPPLLLSSDESVEPEPSETPVIVDNPLPVNADVDLLLANVEHPPVNGEDLLQQLEGDSSSHSDDDNDTAEMAAEIELRKVVAQLQAVAFQITEMHEEIDDVDLMSNSEIVEMYDELKGLRIRLVTLNNEVNLAGDPNRNYDAQVQPLLGTSKDDLKKLKAKVSAIKAAEENKQADRDAAAEKERARLEKEKKEEEIAKANAFKRAVQEIKAVKKSLSQSYCLKDLSTERSEVLRREKEKGVLAAEFTRMRDLVNNLLTQSDVIPQNESVYNELIDDVSAIDKLKKAYEDKVYSDLVENDLTEEKLKLAELTKIDVGKFNGELGIGDDYYTFKSKFTKAYVNHPKSLTVEWLKNNHLEGPAKDAVGSLDSLDEIWDRLLKNFGDTEQMLKYKFVSIDRMGSMARRKGYKAKNVFVQALVNIMQDVLDLAEEHSLTGELNYGEQFSKVINLLENHYQNLWYKIAADESVTKEGRWKRLIKFLNSQLSILQLRAIEENETSSSRDRENKEEKENKKRDNAGGGAGNRLSKVNLVKKLCSFCGDTHPSANTEFTNCKKFLLMSCKERSGLIRRLKYCLQCLSGKTKFNDPNHICADKWVCKNISHVSYQKKLHFLVCELHSKDDENMALFGVFQIEVLTADWQRKLFQGKSGFVSRHTTLVGCKAIEDKPKETDMMDQVIADKSQCGTPTFLLQPVLFTVMCSGSCSTTAVKGFSAEKPQLICCRINAKKT